MKTSEFFQKVRGLDVAELQKLLAAKREELRAVRFDIRAGSETKVHRVSVLKKEIARIMMELKEKTTVVSK